MVETSKANIIVATLILTVTFAAGFTVPGGFDSNPGKNQGMPILLRNTAFKIFVITNALAFLCSISSIFFYNAMVAEASLSSSAKNFRSIEEFFTLSMGMIFYAAIAAVAAFCSGVYAIVAPLPNFPTFILIIGGYIYVFIFLVTVRSPNVSRSFRILDCLKLRT